MTTNDNDDELRNYDDFDYSPAYTKEGLKSTIKPSPLDEIKRYQYRYVSADGKQYILVYYETGLDGISRAKWSKHHHKYFDHEDEDEANGNNELEEEDVKEQISLSKDFDDMIESEGWKKESEGFIIIR